MEPQNLPAPVSPAALCGLKLLPEKLPRELLQMDRAMVLQECSSALSAVEPSRIDEFALVIERLAAHYPDSRLSDAEWLLVMEDWRDDLGHLPADVMRAGAKAYRMSGARFFPTAGQFYAVIKDAWEYREALARRAQTTLDAIAA